MEFIRSNNSGGGRPKELILFDVDGTILPDTEDELTGQAFWRLIEQRVIEPDPNKVQGLRDLKMAHGHKSDNTRRLYLDPLIKIFDNSMRGRTKTELDGFAAELIQDLHQDAFTEVIEEIGQWQEKGAYIGLVSGSPNFIIQALKRQLGADIATGTRYFLSGNRYHLNRPCESRARNKDLVAESMLIDLSRRELGYRALLPHLGHRPRLDDIPIEHRFRFRAGYGDSINDLSMLLASDEAVAVAPKPDLLEIAQNNNWRIIEPNHSGA